MILLHTPLLQIIQCMGNGDKPLAPNIFKIHAFYEPINSIR